jgi:hypothetical protein
MTPAISDSQQTSREVEVVELADLRIDHRYQRPLDQGLVERILSDWDPIAADPLTISQRADGSLWIVNGQHEAAAATLKGETEMLAFIYTGLTVKQEADLRLKKNNRRSDTPLERFHAQVMAGNAESLAIVALLAEFGTEINKQVTAYHGINAVAAVEHVFRWDEGTTLRQTLFVVRDSFGEIKGDAASGALIKGIAWFIRQHAGQVNMRELIRRVSRYDADEIRRKARSHKAVVGGADWINVYRALVEIYNHRRAEHTRIEPRVKTWGTVDRGERHSSDGDWS